MLKQAKISTRLMSAFALTVLALLTVAAVSWQSLSALNRQLLQASTGSEQMKTYSDLQSAILNYGAVARGLSGAASLETITAGIKQADTARAQVQQAQKTLPADEAARLKPALAALTQSVDTMAAQAKSFFMSDANSTLEQKVKPALDAAQRQVSTLIASRSAEIHQGAQEADGAYQRALLLLAAVVTAASVIAVLIASWVTRSITRPLREAVEVANRVAAGDLQVQVRAEANDETGQLLLALGQMVEQLAGAVRQVRDAAGQVKASSRMLVDTSSLLDDSARSQAGAVGNAASSMQQVSVSVSQFAEVAGELRQASAQSLQSAGHGNERMGELARDMDILQGVVGEMASSIHTFVERTRVITNMTREVREIAEQTNLLALNAAIEAARAGEYGRGFAVVADEVRKLAEKSSKSAASIDSITQELAGQYDIVDSVLNKGETVIASLHASSGSVSEALDQSSSAASLAHEASGQMASSVDEQRSACQAIARTMDEIVAMAGKSSDSARASRQQSQALADVAEQLSSVVGRFRMQDGREVIPTRG